MSSEDIHNEYLYDLNTSTSAPTQNITILQEGKYFIDNGGCFKYFYQGFERFID